LSVPLSISFRAAPAVLDFVDAVFTHDAAAAGVALDGAPIRHGAARVGMAGRVELWPKLVPEPADPPAPWEPPVRRIDSEAPRTRLAKRIASQIAHWIQSHEPLAARGRPIRARDVMVLVRRRNRFVEELIAALKRLDVPVAGADRVVLTDQIAVMDLLALGQFLLLPEDDLTLAALLKSPLYGVDEESLFALARDRGGQSLWQRVQDAADAGDPLIALARRELGELLGQADFMPPYELFADLLGARRGRERLLRRLGAEAADAIDEFLNQCLAFERTHPPSLQGLLRWLGGGEAEVKRDPESGERDEVRVMTVHGAKGLQAPIVILPDTVGLPPNRPPPLLWPDAAPVMLWAPRDGKGEALSEAAKAEVKRRAEEEYRRLFYVALTRAEDRLYICGWEGEQRPGAGNWWDLAEAGIRLLGAEAMIDPPPGHAPFTAPGWVVHGAQAAPPKREALGGPVASAGAALPDWAKRAPPPEPTPARPLIASRPSQADPAPRSPLVKAGAETRFQRGLIIHRLLQSLPELDPDSAEAAARRFLARPSFALAPEEQADILRETLAVLRHPDFAAVFGPRSQAEIPVVGLVGDRALSGRIDRLVVTEDEIMIVDYKTNRPPPKRWQDTPPAYIEQLAAYRAALALIYPGRRTRTLLLWTDDLNLMEIPG
jgi:ATP-dependent helicase/nuclease subunit A